MPQMHVTQLYRTSNRSSCASAHIHPLLLLFSFSLCTCLLHTQSFLLFLSLVLDVEACFLCSPFPFPLGRPSAGFCIVIPSCAENSNFSLFLANLSTNVLLILRKQWRGRSSSIVRYFFGDFVLFLAGLSVSSCAYATRARWWLCHCLRGTQSWGCSERSLQAASLGLPSAILMHFLSKGW